MELRPIPGFTGYFANTDGYIFSNRVERVGMRECKVKVLRGVPEVRIRLSAFQQEAWRVADLVAITFLDPVEPAMCPVNIDGDRLNCAVANLRCVTMEEADALGQPQRKRWHVPRAKTDITNRFGDDHANL